jgi:MoxR-like ATPase
LSSAQTCTTIEEVLRQLEQHQYIADRSLATTIYLACRLQKPIFLEGEPGVGKTEVARVLSDMLSTRLIRLQCYEGLDAASALYEWNYTKQLLRIKMEEQCGRSPEEIGSEIYTEDYLIKRPLLEAIQSARGQTPVLLIDELDRADEEFEAFLLEVLSDFQISIPEIGTLKALHIPVVVVTSNRTRDVHDALKRRCLYYWIDYPDYDKEVKIIHARVPGLENSLAAQVTAFMQAVREQDFMKKPGISETLDWAEALVTLHANTLDQEVVEQTLGCIFKYREDIQQFRAGLWSDPGRRDDFLESLRARQC